MSPSIQPTWLSEITNSSIKSDIDEIKEAINKAEIVHCNECKYWGGRYADDECSLITMLADPRYWLKTKPYDFCSSGERKMNENKEVNNGGTSKADT